MPATQAIQAVSKTYVDQAIEELTGSLLTASGGTLSGPLTLCCDPVTPMQAADKRYVDASVASGVTLSGGAVSGPLTATQLGALYQVDQFAGADFGAKLGACLSGLSTTQGGTCDARNFSGTLGMGSSLTISTGNATVLLPCATISTANQIVVTAGTRNVTLRGCALRGTSTASGSQGGTVFYYSGTGAMVQVGDPTYAADTLGFHLDNVAINTTLSSSASAQGFVAYRTQELDLESLYFLGNSNQTGMTLDGTGNYTGGSFYDNEFTGFQTAVNAIGHQVANAATTDWMNASTFLRLHIDCPTSGGNPISGTYGINLQQGDGNTFTGGDVEGCATALHLGANAQNNTIVGLRNENSTNQVVADAGSSYNNWMTGGTMFTGRLTDNGTRNSFLDTFHRSFNGLNGDWYGSQADATVTNHLRLGIGTGNERGLLNEIQTDYGYRWLYGFTDATAGEQFYQIQDLLNNVGRLAIGQYNNGQSSTNNQTVINAAGTGAVVLNGSNNSGTGGVVFGSGGPSETTVGTINNAGNAQFNGTLLVGGTAQSTGTMTVRNNADAEVDYYLWPGLTTSQKGSYTYKDWNGNSQWYMVKDASNNWSLNSATGGLDSFKAYQSTNSGDTYINASNSSGIVRVNYESGSGTGFNIYGGGSSNLYASFTSPTTIKFPGLAASSGHNCVQIDNSGYITNTGSACGTGSSNGTVNAGTSGQIAYYNGTGTVLSGTSTVSVAAGGTGASTASGALSNLGGAPLAGAAFTGPVSTISTLSVANNSSMGPRFDVTNAAFGAVGNGSTDDTAAIQAAFNTCANYVSSTKTLTGSYGGIVEFPGLHSYVISSTINAYDGCRIEGTAGKSSTGDSPPSIIWNGATAGTVYTITGFTAAANTTPLYTLSSPAPTYQGNLATFTVSGGSVPSVGQWVDIEGLSTSAGMYLNRVIAQVAATSGSTFTVTFPMAISAGTFTDTGTATTVNVMVAFDANSRYETAISNIVLTTESTTLDAYQVGFYFGSRVDTGTHMEHTEVAGASMYGYYFAAGGINVDFDKGWRSDGAGIAGIYWRVTGGDNFGLANGTTDNGTENGSSTSGAAVMLDNSACVSGTLARLTVRNVKHEINTSMSSGLGVYTLLDCPSNSNGAQFFLDFEQVWMSPSEGMNAPGIMMTPTNDMALTLSIVNSAISGGGGEGGRWVGLPGLTRNDLGGSDGYIPLLSFSPAVNSAGGLSSAYSAAAAPTQLLNDLNFNQVFHYGIQASDFLYSDTAYAALPNGTTLRAGQILAPPSYWNGANGKRYALDVVYQAGTTGTPNSGATSCSGSSGTSTLTCSSATDLSTGQRISIGTDTNKTLRYVDATNPSAVLLILTSNLGTTYSNQLLSFSAPVLGPEIQMPTKSSSAPTTLTWSQGDMEQNSGATANGVAAWVNVTAGTPGTWAGIPLGNSSGQISSSQISNLAFQSLTTSGTSGAATLSGGVLNIPQYAGGGSMTYPGAGIAVSTGSAWATSLTAPASAIVGISDTQTLTNKSINASEVNSGTLPASAMPALTGDVTNTAGSLATTVGKVNGASVPASANATSTNSSSQFVASTTHNLSVPANCIAASGSGTAYTCSTTPTFTPATGDHIQFKADVANTGSATLAVNGATAATFKKWGGSGSLIANDLLAGHWISATFDGTYWQLEGQLGNANATQVNGASVPVSAPLVGTNSSSQPQSVTTLPTSAMPALTGDVTNTAGSLATTVGKVNGASVPASANVTSTNSSSQFVASTTHNLSVPANCIAASGSGTAYTCSTTPTFTPATGDHIQFKADVANTGSATLAVNGATAATFKKWGGSGSLIANDLLAGHWISATFDGTYWQLEGQLGNANATELNGTSITGLSGSGSTLALTTSPTIASPTFTGTVTTPLTTAGVVTTTSGGVLGSEALQGTDTKVLTAGTISGSGTPLCADANGGATTSGCSSGAVVTNTPAGLMNLGTGVDGSYEWSSTGSCSNSPTHCYTGCTSSAPCNTLMYDGEMYVTNLWIDSGAYVSGNMNGTGAGTVIHATGACTIAGTMLFNGVYNTWPNTNKGIIGGSSGGSGGGTAAGTAGVASTVGVAAPAYGTTAGGSAGAASGGNGTSGSAFAYQRAAVNSGLGGLDGQLMTGSAGVQGGSTGGAGGHPGSGLVMICASLNGSGGVIDTSGGYGSPAAANSTGAGSGGGGGVVVLSSQATVSTWPTIYTAGGPGGLCTVPEALATGGSCTTQPKVTLGVTSGAFSGTATVVQAGAGCGTGTGITWNFLGGGGTPGTATVNPTWSSGALSSVTVTAGTSSGYTAATYTTCGTGGDGGVGWYAEYAGW
jgi:hypothetical protein